MDSFLDIFKNKKFINNSFFIKRNKISINKKNNNIKFKILPHFIKSNDKNDNLKLYKIIKNYLSVMNRDCKNFDSTIFTKNFKKTLFNLEDLNKNLNSDFDGKVLLNRTNELQLKNFKVVYHELLHLSSLEKIYTEPLFTPYNEGYTQNLAERYFNENKEMSYNIYVIIMKNIEAIIGIDYMEEKYFKGKLQNTINKLLDYESKENIKILLKYMRASFDIQNDIENAQDKEMKFDMLQSFMNVIFSILTNCLKNRLEEGNSLIEKVKMYYSFNIVSVIEYHVDGKVYKINLFNEDQIKKLKSCLYGNSNLENETIKNIN